MSIKRNNRLSGELKKVISESIRDLKDPRISNLTSVTDVQITEDLKFAKVYISVYGDIDSTLKALRNAKGFIKRDLGKKVKMRITPELIFEKDDSIEKALYMSSLISKVISEDEENKKNEENEEDDEDDKNESE